MFFVLSKALVFLLSPLIWVFAIFIYAALEKGSRKGMRALITGIAVLLVFSNAFLVNEAFLAWETLPVPITKLKKYDTAVVLTGVTNNLKSVKDRVYFDKGADRVLHAVQLYKLGIVDKILISGGSSTVIGEKKPEADELLKVFLYCGIPMNSLIIENQSRNTVESARNSKKIIDKLHLGKDLLLITSSYHIKRSIGCFSKVGLKVDPYPVDFYTYDTKNSFTSLFLPSEYAISKWSILLHEIVGFYVYKLLGYSS